MASSRPLVGALILVPLEEISNNLLGGKGAGLTFVVYGAISWKPS